MKPFQRPPVASIHGLRERPVDPALELKTIQPDFHRDQIAAVHPFEPGSRCGQPGILRPELLRDLEECLRVLHLLLRRADAEVGVVRDLEGAAARAFGQAAFGEGLDTPGDPPVEELLVVGAGLLAEDLGVLLAELGHGQPAEFRDLIFNRASHCCLPSWGR